MLRGLPTTYHWVDMNVIEESSITNAATAIDLTSGAPVQLGNLVFLNDTFGLGDATYAGSIGINFLAATQLADLETTSGSIIKRYMPGLREVLSWRLPLPSRKSMCPLAAAVR